MDEPSPVTTAGGASDSGWSGPGAAATTKRRFTWNDFLWSLVWPQRAHRIVPTVSGILLVALALGIGTAAYNSSSNILFITLSLLLACLILSGVLSSLNLRRVAWRLRVGGALRAGHDAVASLELRNGKTVLPTYSLWFDFTARPTRVGEPQRAESTVSGRGLDIRAMFAKAEAGQHRGRAPLRARLEPQGTTRLEWVFRPEQRGVMRVELAGVGSLFPFGFLKKTVATDAQAEAVVWPAPVEYQRHAVMSSRRPAGGERIARAGPGNDLFALRRYAPGDSHRLIHWKASARTQQWLVRQFSAESAEGFALWLRTDAAVWAREEQFELLVSFCATLAEDLFRAGQLLSVAINDEPPMAVRRLHDLELFLGQLAIVRPKGEGVTATDADATAVVASSRQNVLTFVPDGPRGVAAYVDGQKAASA